MSAMAEGVSSEVTAGPRTFLAASVPPPPHCHEASSFPPHPPTWDDALPHHRPRKTEAAEDRQTPLQLPAKEIFFSLKHFCQVTGIRTHS